MALYGVKVKGTARVPLLLGSWPFPASRRPWLSSLPASFWPLLHRHSWLPDDDLSAFPLQGPLWLICPAEVRSIVCPSEILNLITFTESLMPYQWMSSHGLSDVWQLKGGYLWFREPNSSKVRGNGNSVRMSCHTSESLTFQKNSV